MGCGAASEEEEKCQRTKTRRKAQAKPLWEKIVKVLRSIYVSYVDLKSRFDRLYQDYGRVRESNARLSDRLQEVKMENTALRRVAADYERVKRAFGPEEVDRVLEADRQREQTIKKRRQSRDRDAR